ncbi:hypothetical protein GUITHDRAFT_149804 [Guillardia theta CCMP2712]|uniref:Uncharacterized protein n=1 Tax=Guillardia theta (strain CCMP2712) TaxID=905079 RepID=L1K3U3_GUITC|nr:hypothetical protein GUITHDRAFT_149804 [Guillardia theta CCMP2712]EKX55486.1 hypothetical protein GUITHDRAFT_149804 [Guillardia theta CCMP2712]|mmetsp:Transcript_39521/g.124330  ORF Transcript_39521/g.124330 Transcript_39521/m.124330 type:complete len:238 (-) Transcript_39521:57-770(-)|eukprot:XP_005842466.1 hypothetical protein GUITHDRAFT_149804 [Guillardia theta CCMP2712]
MGVFGKCLRVTGESLSTFLFLTSVALLTFGIFLYIKWESDETTSSHPIPGYIYLIMSVGGSASLGNLVGYMGACSRSSLVLSCSVWFLFVVVLCELSLSLVLLLNPSLIDTVVCPEGDEACINKLDNMFKDPSSHAGIVVACVCGCQLFALIILGLLQRDIRRSNQESDADALAWERGGMRRTLLEEYNWEQRRAEFEERSRKRAQRALESRSVLSDVARQALSAHRAQPSESWDSP